MKFARITRRRILGLLLAIFLPPAALWAVVVCVAPTDWARTRLVNELESISGRKVSIGLIELGWLGNLRIKDIAVAEGVTADDPWLKVNEARLDVHLVQMLCRQCKPTAIAIDGLSLRVHRRADGTLEFASLLGGPRSAPIAAGRPDDAPKSTTRQPLTLTLTGARVLVVDDPGATRIELTEGEGVATWDGALAKVETWRARLNGGSIELAGTYDRASKSPEFHVELRAHNVGLGGGMKSLGLLVPVVADLGSALDGKAQLKLTLEGKAIADAPSATASGLKGFGAIRLDPIDLTGSKLLESLDGLYPMPRSARMASVESHFAIESGRVTTDDLTLQVAHVPLVLAGWTDFGGRIDYRVKSEGLRDRLAGRLPGDVRQILGEIQTDLGDLASVRITGTIDAPRLTAGGRAIGNGRPGDDDKARLKEAAKKLHDRYLR